MHNDNNYTSSNMLVLFVVVVLLFGNVFAAPSLLTKDEDNDDFVEFYDQRQNGTENIRIDMNGMVIVVSPLEALLAAATLLDPIFPSDFEDEFNFKKTSKGSENKHPVSTTTGTHNSKRESIQNPTTTEKNNNTINNKKKG